MDIKADLKRLKMLQREFADVVSKLESAVYHHEDEGEAEEEYEVEDEEAAVEEMPAVEEEEDEEKSFKMQSLGAMMAKKMAKKLGA